MENPLRDKVCLVTGGTSGIGRVAAMELAKQGAKVIVTGRDEARGAAVVADIQRAANTNTNTNTASAVFLAADLSEQSNVRRLAGQVQQRCDKLDILINNAGTVYAERKLTRDGIERTLATNHLAPFLLTNLLHGQLAAAGGSARVVTVSSDAHRFGRIDLDDLGGQARYSPIGAYSNSKLANILFTTELTRRWKGEGVTANSLHPGVVRTNIWSNSKGGLRLLTWLAQPFMISAERGARTIVYLAASSEVDGTTGAYFVKCREVVPAPAARDAELAARLWEASAKLTGLA